MKRIALTERDEYFKTQCDNIPKSTAANNVSFAIKKYEVCPYFKFKFNSPRKYAMETNIDIKTDLTIIAPVRRQL